MLAKFKKFYLISNSTARIIPAPHVREKWEYKVPLEVFLVLHLPT